MSELTRGLECGSGLGGQRRELEIAAEASTRVVGCTGASTPLGLKAPRDVAAVLHMLGLSAEAALAGVSEIPQAIVTRNRLKTERPQLEEGVRTVRRSVYEG